MTKRKNANGEHSIFYDNSSECYKGQIVVGYYPNGRVKRKSVFGKTKTEVRQKLKQVELGIMSDTYVDESTITIYQLGKQIQDDKLNFNEIKQATYHRNLETLKHLESIHSIPIQRANETLLKSFLLSQVGYSQSTIDKAYITLQSVFNEAVKRNIIKKSPMANIKKPKSKAVKEKVRALTVDEQARLINVLQTKDIKYSQQMLLSMFTGLRMGEINALHVEDINLLFNTITVKRTISKGEKGEAFISGTAKTEAGRRTIRFTAGVKDIFEDCLRYKESGLIFTTERGGMITTNQVNMELSRLLAKYDVLDKTVAGKVTCHSLRHTYATRCIEAGMQAKTLQILLGHTDVKTTLNTYCDVFDSLKQEEQSKVDEYLQSKGVTLSA